MASQHQDYCFDENWENANHDSWASPAKFSEGEATKVHMALRLNPPEFDGGLSYLIESMLLRISACKMPQRWVKICEPSEVRAVHFAEVLFGCILCN